MTQQQISAPAARERKINFIIVRDRGRDEAAWNVQ